MSVYLLILLWCPHILSFHSTKLCVKCLAKFQRSNIAYHLFSFSGCVFFFLVDFLFKLWLERLDIISFNDFDDTAIYMECVCTMKHGFTWTKHRLHRTTSAAIKPCPRASKVWDYFTQRPSMWCSVSLANLIGI